MFCQMLLDCGVLTQLPSTAYTGIMTVVSRCTALLNKEKFYKNLDDEMKRGNGPDSCCKCGSMAISDDDIRIMPQEGRYVIQQNWTTSDMPPPLYLRELLLCLDCRWSGDQLNAVPPHYHAQILSVHPLEVNIWRPIPPA